MMWDNVRVVDVLIEFNENKSNQMLEHSFSILNCEC